MKNPYVIMNPTGKFFRGYTDAIPAIIHGFTDSWQFALKFATLEAAKRQKNRLLDRLYDFNGNDKVPKDYLRIAKAELRIVG